ncbi:hypothetical protein D3C77_752710 [compost metagenome]
MWARSLRATRAPRNTIHTKNQRDSSSDTLIPELKAYRKTTLPKTSTTMPSMHSTMSSLSRRK